MSACVVPLCPALAVKGRKCALHQFAMTAYAARCMDARCAVCGRGFLKPDYVMRAPDEQVGTTKGLVISRWRHVHCTRAEKRPTKREMAESPKPLLEDLA